MRWLATPSALAGLVFAAGISEAAEKIDVDLELVLAVDVSRSMDRDEQELQRQGYVSAFRHPEVIRAITAGAYGQIAVTYVEWAGIGMQTLVVPWTVIAGRADSESFAARIAAAPLTGESGTSISSALLFAATQLKESAFRGDRRAVDVSGDGPNNMGYPVDITRDWLIRQGVTINGLPIMLKTDDSFGPFDIPRLDVYYEDCVIGGPGAFMLTVDAPASFEAAIRRKLLLEIAGLPPHIMPTALDTIRKPRVDCQIGEKARRDWLLLRGR
jgi:hypothetical protein